VARISTRQSRRRNPLENVDERFLESIVHKRAPHLARWRGYSGHVVLGRRLRPFSLWHQQMLEGIGSPFLSTWPRNPTSLQLVKTLYLATQVCRLHPLETLRRATWRDALRRKWLVFRFYFRLGFKRPGLRLTRLLIEAAKFRAYMNDYSSAPIPFPNKKKSRPIESPPSLYQLELYLRFHRQVELRDAWGKSPAEIGWANIAAQEADGAEISIMTQARMEAREIAMHGRKPKSNGNGNGHA
jgi:hypothetical protein